MTSINENLGYNEHDTADFNKIKDEMDELIKETDLNLSS
jgi:hypothetical protein